MNLLFPFLGTVQLAEAASAPEAGGLETGTVLQALMVLVMIWLASSVANLRSQIEALRESLAVKPRPAPGAVAGPTPAEIAAIAAAVHHVLGAGARVVAVVPPGSDGQAWSREGRREVFQSHQIR